MSTPILATIIMVKNEMKRITVSLDSVNGITDKVIILDTGSTDDTIKVIREYAEKNNMDIDIIEKTFNIPFEGEPQYNEDGTIKTYFHFSKSRNYLIEYADNKADYLLLLDCNDELRGGKALRNFINTNKDENYAYHVLQKWWNGISHDTYFNVRLIKTNSNWRYKGPIHEWLHCDVPQTYKLGKIPETIVIYQDRTQDDDKSQKRFLKDELIFESEMIRELKENGRPDPRTLFYYGQTCMCLQRHEKSFHLNRERTERDDGFFEEKYHSYYRCGELSQTLQHSEEETMIWYLKSFEYSAKMFNNPRVEPLYKLAEMYFEKFEKTNDRQYWEMAYLFINRAIKLKFPVECILFVDSRVYHYKRWNLLARMCCRRTDTELRLIGVKACFNAIEAEDNQIDKDILSIYLPTQPQECKRYITLLRTGKLKADQITMEEEKVKCV